MTRKTKKWLIWISILIVVLVIVISPLFAFIKSITVMSIASVYEYRHSVMKDHGVEIHMKGGLSTKEKDWFPFVMTFNPIDEYFSRRVGRDASLTIMYNFGAFEYAKGASSMYNEESPYFSSFYGAYVVEDKQQAFGFYEDGSLNTQELSMVASYDMRVLVLRSLGCETAFFDYEVTAIEVVDTMVGFDGWTMMDSVIYTNSPVHESVEDHIAYIQYGRCPKVPEEDFEPITLYGRVYAKYFEQEDITVCFYVIGASESTVEETDELFLQTAELDIYE